MIKLVFSNIRTKLFSCALLTAVLAATLILAVPPVNSVSDALGNEMFYRSAGLEQVYYFSPVGQDVKTILNILNGEPNIIGAGYNSATTLDGFSEFVPVGSGFFESLNFSFKKRLKDLNKTEGVPAVVCKSLGRYYEIGKTYTEGIRIGFNEIYLTFTVVGILQSDRGYFYSSRGIKKADNFVYLITDGSADWLYDNGNIYFTANSLDEATTVASKILGKDTVVNSVAKDYDTIRDINLEKLNVPIIVTVLSFLLSLSYMLSHSILLATACKKKYSILFACGCTPKKLVAIHLISDLLPALLAAVIASVTVAINIMCGNNISIYSQYSLSGLITVIVAAAIIFVISELLAATTVMESQNVGLADER